MTPALRWWYCGVSLSLYWTRLSAVNAINCTFCDLDQTKTKLMSDQCKSKAFQEFSGTSGLYFTVRESTWAACSNHCTTRWPRLGQCFDNNYTFSLFYTSVTHFKNWRYIYIFFSSLHWGRNNQSEQKNSLTFIWNSWCPLQATNRLDPAYSAETFSSLMQGILGESWVLLKFMQMRLSSERMSSSQDLLCALIHRQFPLMSVSFLFRGRIKGLHENFVSLIKAVKEKQVSSWL